MTISHYVFAFYVFLLICAVLWIASRVIQSRKRDDKSSYEKEQRLFKLYQNIEDMMNSFEEYVEEVKREINESMAKDLSGLEETRNTSAKANADIDNRMETLTQSIIKPKVEPSDVLNEKQTEQIVESISKLANEGIGEEQIAKELGVSSRQVSLIMKIKKMKK